MFITHHEKHRNQHSGWLRAAVLGANDGIVSTASLVVGIAASNATHSAVLLAGVAGLVAGAMSMAAGEYVSVCSQADTEKADMEREKHELATDPVGEQAELTAIYVERGLSPELSHQVAEQLMAHDALAAHARDELGVTQNVARPVQAAMASAAAFIVGAALPLFVVWVAPVKSTGVFVTGTSLVFLAVLGILAAYTGGAPLLPGAVRVTFWGALAMAITAGVGALFGTAI
ncbi:MAG: VIT family protein [Armatimonadetes bacterium]|nr:VIT family protein [Armatimonadota bacterium]